MYLDLMQHNRSTPCSSVPACPRVVHDRFDRVLAICRWKLKKETSKYTPKSCLAHIKIDPLEDKKHFTHIIIVVFKAATPGRPNTMFCVQNVIAHIHYHSLYEFVGGREDNPSEIFPDDAGRARDVK